MLGCGHLSMPQLKMYLPLGPAPLGENQPAWSSSTSRAGRTSRARNKKGNQLIF